MECRFNGQTCKYDCGQVEAIEQDYIRVVNRSDFLNYRKTVISLQFDIGTLSIFVKFRYPNFLRKNCC